MVDSVTEQDALKNLKRLRDSFAENISKYNLRMESFVLDEEIEDIFEREGVEDENSLNFSRVCPSTIGKYLTENPKKAKENLCNTSCCIVGYAAISGVQDFIPLDTEGDFGDYSHRLFCGDGPTWEFMFGGEHEDDTDEALIRLNVVISLLENDKTWEEIEEIMEEWDDDFGSSGYLNPHFYKNWEEILNAAIG